MILINKQTKEEVKKGDIVYLSRPKRKVKLVWLSPPHKPSSSGKITVNIEGLDFLSSGATREYYPSVIGCEFIEEETKDCFFTYTKTEVFHLTTEINKREEEDLRLDPSIAMEIWQKHHTNKSDDLITDVEEVSEVCIEEEEL